jgi:hypothetical protein
VTSSTSTATARKIPRKVRKIPPLNDPRIRFFND